MQDENRRIETASYAEVLSCTGRSFVHFLRNELPKAPFIYIGEIEYILVFCI